jgi:hypothetical protein
MTHLAIQEQLAGLTGDWKEQESSQQSREEGGFGSTVAEARASGNTIGGAQVMLTFDRFRQMSNAERRRT